MPSQIQVRRDIAANWSTVNPVLRAGEIGFTTDTKIMKIGDGVTAWDDLGALATEAARAALALQVTSIGAILTDHTAAGGTKHTKAQIGLANVADVLQVRADASGYADSPSPASTTKLYARTAAGDVAMVPWSSVPGAAPAMTSVAGVAGTDTVASVISADVLNDVITAVSSASVGAVTTVNGVAPSAGNVLLDLDDLASGTTNQSFTAADEAKLDGIDAAAKDDSELYEVTTDYQSAPGALVAMKSAARRLILPTTRRAWAVVNDVNEAITVAPPEGVTAEGALFVPAGAAGTFLDLDLAAHSLPTSGIQKATVSWFGSYPSPVIASEQCIFSNFGTSNACFEAYMAGTSTKQLVIRCRKAGGTTVLEQRTALSPFTYDAMHHFILSIDLTVPRCQLAIDDTLVTFATSGYTPVLTLNESWAHPQSNFRIGGRSQGTTANYTGNLAQFFMIFGQALDLSVTDDRRKFCGSGGSVVNLGFNGWRPFSAAPHVFLNGDGSAFATNQVNGVAGTATGTLQAASLTVSGQTARWLIRPASGSDVRTATVPVASSEDSGRRQFVKVNGANVYRVL